MILENGGIFGLDYGLISRLREPNNAGDGEDCVTVLSVDENNMAEQFYYGGWNDDRCSKPYSFVCELFPEGTPWSEQTITYPTTGTGINDQRLVFCHTWAGSDGPLIFEKVFLPFGQIIVCLFGGIIDGISRRLAVISSHRR